MLHIVLFEDNPDAPPGIRAAHMQAHLAFLERNAGAVRAAGPLREPSGAPAGGLWLVEAPDAAAIERLVHEDPLWPTGLRRSVRILAWTQVFADGDRLAAPA